MDLQPVLNRILTELLLEIQWESIMKQFYANFHPVVEDVKKNATRETGQRILGTDPKSGRQLSVRLGKFG